MHALLPRRPRAARLALTLVAGVLAGPALAQVGTPTDDDFKAAPPQFREAVSNGKFKPDPSEMTRQDVKGAPPSADPRDLNGMYNFLREPAKAPGGAAGGPGGPGGPGARGGPGGPGGKPGSSTGKNACAYSFPGLTSYSTTILINDRSAVFLMEENHGLRWARFADRHPATVQPSYTGDSIARWDGNTLIVDTVGVRVNGQQATDHYEERFTKLPDGNIKITRFKADDSGALQPTGGTTLRWRPDLHYVEDICEDLGEAFGVNYQ